MGLLVSASAEEMERCFSIPIEVGSCRYATRRRHWLAVSHMFALCIASAIMLAGLYGVGRNRQ